VSELVSGDVSEPGCGGGADSGQGVPCRVDGSRWRSRWVKWRRPDRL